jgi:hypothetical protein
MKRGTMLTLVAMGIGIILAVAIGVVLYFLNVQNRLN